MKLTRSFAAFALLGAALTLSVPVAAQVPSIGVVAPAMRQSYSAVTAVTPAASATDIFALTGSATKTVRVTRVACSGIATATGSQVLHLVKRSTADAGGTSTTLNAVKLDSNNGAATATGKAYTVNPVTPGTTVGTLRAASLTLATSTTPAVADRLVWDFGSNFTTDQAVTLRGTGEVLAINANGNSLPSGSSLTCGFEWNEQ